NHETEVFGLKTKRNSISKKNLKDKTTDATAGTPDTLRYFDTNFSTNFVFFDQDVIITFFEAPADMIIKSAGFSIADESAAANGSEVSIRLIKSNWTMNQIRALRENKYLGYYPSEGDGYNNSDYFGENATGGWIDSTNGVYPTMPWMHEDYDLWSDNMNGVSIIPELQNGSGLYQWVDMSSVGYEPDVLHGSVIGVVLKHEGTGTREDRLGVYSSGTAEVPSWKYYEYGRDDSTSPGWWTRTYTFDMALAVRFTGGGYPRVDAITELQTTLSEDPREVQAIVYYYDPSHSLIDSVNLLVETIAGTQEIRMENISEDKYSGTIPGFPSGTRVSYSIRIYYRVSPTGPSRYIDWSGYTYTVFKPREGVYDLVVWNGFSEARVRQLFPYYFQGLASDWSINGEYDFWISDHVTSELLNHYNRVINIFGGKSYINHDYLKGWLSDGEKALVLIGDEFIGAKTGWVDTTFTSGSFFYDVLGITDHFNDINYEVNEDLSLPSIVFPIESSLIGNELFDDMKLNNVDTLFYYPNNVTGEPNWLDGYNLHKGEPFMKGLSKSGVEHIIGHYVEYKDSRIVFMAFDPLSLESANGFWYGNSIYSPFYQALLYLTPILSAEETDGIPQKFSLSQNYPNPFNPHTVIKFQVPSSKFIKLQVYDILGREIHTLVNGEYKPGNYSVDFNAEGLSSGVYFYKLSAGNFSQTKKMILLR
ncbi:MAG: T9SS type A sorting domain-containing protein, partial [Bacteroidota bacterium]